MGFSEWITRDMPGRCQIRIQEIRCGVGQCEASILKLRVRGKVKELIVREEGGPIEAGLR